MQTSWSPIREILKLVLRDIERQRNGRSFAPQTIAQGGVSAMGNEIEVAPFADDASALVSVNRTDAIGRTE